jgi:hypothetical protein
MITDDNGTAKPTPGLPTTGQASFIWEKKKWSSTLLKLPYLGILLYADRHNPMLTNHQVQMFPVLLVASTLVTPNISHRAQAPLCAHIFCYLLPENTAVWGPSVSTWCFALTPESDHNQLFKLWGNSSSEIPYYQTLLTTDNKNAWQDSY